MDLMLFAVFTRRRNGLDRHSLQPSRSQNATVHQHSQKVLMTVPEPAGWFWGLKVLDPPASIREANHNDDLRHSTAGESKVASLREQLGKNSIRR